MANPNVVNFHCKVMDSFYLSLTILVLFLSSLSTLFFSIFFILHNLFLISLSFPLCFPSLSLLSLSLSLSVSLPPPALPLIFHTLFSPLSLSVSSSPYIFSLTPLFVFLYPSTLFSILLVSQSPSLLPFLSIAFTLSSLSVLLLFSCPSPSFLHLSLWFCY